MRGAVGGVTPLRGIRMRERDYNFILKSDRAHAPYCTYDCQYCHATCKTLKLETACHPQREIPSRPANPARVSKST
jgi:hypothetical protein